MVQRKLCKKAFPIFIKECCLKVQIEHKKILEFSSQIMNERSKATQIKNSCKAILQ